MDKANRQCRWLTALEYVRFQGLEEGEKINEDLWEEWEMPEPTQHDHIMTLTGAETRPGVLEQIEEMERQLARADNGALLACLHRAFPEFAAARPKVVPIRAEKPPTVNSLNTGNLREVAA